MIDLYGEHLSLSLHKMFGQHAPPGTNFNDDVSLLNAERIDDAACIAFIDQETLTEALLGGRLRRGLQDQKR